MRRASTVLCETPHCTCNLQGLGPLAYLLHLQKLPQLDTQLAKHILVEPALQLPL